MKTFGTPELVAADKSPHAENYRDVEANLDAVSRTPKACQEELGRHVHIPELLKLSFILPSYAVIPQALEDLKAVVGSLDVIEDPWVIRMRAHPETAKSHRLSKILLNGATYVRRLFPFKTLEVETRQVHSSAASKP